MSLISHMNKQININLTNLKLVAVTVPGSFQIGQMPRVSVRESVGNFVTALNDSMIEWAWFKRASSSRLFRGSFWVTHSKQLVHKSHFARESRCKTSFVNLFDQKNWFTGVICTRIGHHLCPYVNKIDSQFFFLPDFQSLFDFKFIVVNI